MNTNVERCIQAQTELFGNGRVELADDLDTSDCIDHTAPREVPPGPEGIKAVVDWLHGTFGELSYAVEDAFGSGDRVAVRCTVSGVLHGDLAGHPPNGRRFENAQIHVYRLEDGRIAEHWGVRDDVTMMRQLGLLGD
jgi:predicted ester cyclase